MEVKDEDFDKATEVITDPIPVTLSEWLFDYQRI